MPVTTRNFIALKALSKSAKTAIPYLNLINNFCATYYAATTLLMVMPRALILSQTAQRVGAEKASCFIYISLISAKRERLLDADIDGFHISISPFLH